ncbi:MAG TPA: hypothetical protein VKR26_02385 [Terriglobales bacterium]|jgi:hypothetical protein|nr:hypothetical protein [Terriglobales bacterium]
MLRYECDYCHRLKEKDEAWILGFAAENIGVTSARREVTILPVWDEVRAVDYLAVHFCCEQCRQNYMANIFGEEPAQAEIVEEVAVVPRKRIVREYPGRAVETRVVRRKASAPKSRSKAKSSRHKAA